MRLLIKLLLSISSFLLLAGVLYLMLPVLVAGVLRAELHNQGFDVFEIDVGKVDLEGAILERLRASNGQYLISLRGLKVSYRVPGLLAGMADSVNIEQLDLSLLAAEKPGSLLPDPGLVSGLLGLAWHEFLPVRQFRIQGFTLYDDTHSLILNAMGDIFRNNEQLEGEFMLVDREQSEYRIKLNMASGTGIELELVSQDDGQFPLSIRLQPLAGREGLNGQAQLNLAALAPLADSVGRISGEVKVALDYFEMQGTDTRQLDIELEVSMFELEDLKLEQLRAQVSALVVESEDQFQLSLRDRSSFEVTELHYPQISFGEMVLSLPDSLLVTKHGGVRVTPEAKTGFVISDLKMQGTDLARLQAEGLALDTTQAGKCTVSMNISSSDLLMDTARISHSPAQLEGVCEVNDALGWQLDVVTPEVTYADEAVLLVLGECRASVGNLHDAVLLDDDPMELEGAAGCLSGPLGSEVDAEYRLHAANGVGRLHFTVTDIAPNESMPLISGIMMDWQEPYEIVSGTLAIEGIYRWWENSQGQGREKLLLNLELLDAGGFYDTILFSGLSYAGAIEVLPNLQSTEYARIEVDSVDIGMPINGSSLKLSLEPSMQGDLPLMVIDELRLPMFKGEIQGSNVRIDPNAEEQEILLLVRGLDLANIVETQQLEGLLATGTLDGQIPVKISLRGPSVSGGKIIARKPGGRIQYTAPESEAIESSAPGSELLLKILEDLQYDSLEVDLDYRENGDMQMLLAIRGVSPQVDEQRPVHFNLSLEQNLLKLLQQLRYAVGISDSIDQNVQEYFDSQAGIK